ncbi:hypothetical protein BH09DEP1_BH09DEP1_0470 [soil metagenome]
MLHKYLVIFMIIVALAAVGMDPQKANRSPVFIKRVTNNSRHEVTIYPSYFFGYLDKTQDKPIATIAPQETKKWDSFLPMPVNSIHFLAQFHAVTMMVGGGYEDSPGSRTFNTCLLTYFNPQVVERKLLKDHAYIVEIVLGDRKRDGQVKIDSLQIIESPLSADNL